jgi:hypothetical protein
MGMTAVGQVSNRRKKIGSGMSLQGDGRLAPSSVCKTGVSVAVVRPDGPDARHTVRYFAALVYPPIDEAMT